MILKNLMCRKDMEKFISTIDGNFNLVDRHDPNTDIGCVCIYDEDGNFWGDFNGQLSDYTDEELEEKFDEVVDY